MHLLFGFSGRIGRGQWWLAQLAGILLVLVGVCLAVPFAADYHTDGLKAFANLSAGWIAIFLVLVGVTSWINIASTVKRFHDRNKSGWWFFIVFAPYIGSLWQFVECGCLAGTPGANDYGSPNGTGRTLALEDFDIERIAASGTSVGARTRQSAALPVGAIARRPATQGFGRRVA